MPATLTAWQQEAAPSKEVARPRTSKGMLQVFFYLQLLDLLTTLVGFRVGAAEASPFVRILVHAGPVAGVAASKLIALSIGAFALYMKRDRVVRLLTYFSAGLVTWNLLIILASTAAR